MGVCTSVEPGKEKGRFSHRACVRRTCALGNVPHMLCCQNRALLIDTQIGQDPISTPRKSISSWTCALSAFVSTSKFSCELSVHGQIPLPLSSCLLHSLPGSFGSFWPFSHTGRCRRAGPLSRALSPHDVHPRPSLLCGLPSRGSR